MVEIIWKPRIRNVVLEDTQPVFTVTALNVVLVLSDFTVSSKKKAQNIR